MDFAKKHKNIVIAVIIFVLVLIVFLYTNRVLNASENKAVYGTRLDAIKDVKINESRESQIKEVLKDVSKKVTIREQGRIVEIDMVANDDLARDTAKAKAGEVLSKFSEKERKVYDVQIFIKKEKEDAAFPIIGYAHHNKAEFSWTKDR